MRFDLERYLSHVSPVEVDDLDFDAFRERPLDESTLRVLRYMHDIESHTVCYQRDLLVTRAHDDPVLTSFLTMWAFEEHWHGAAIGRVLTAHGEAAGIARTAPLRWRRRARQRVDTLAAALSSLVTRHVTAVHMCWGAVNEWTTQAGYLLLAQRSEHPVLAVLLRRIARQEGRHIDFYVAQANERLAERRAQQISRWALRRLWAPVGSGVAPQAETDYVVRHLFGGAEGVRMAARIDERIGRLPGLAGLRLVTDACRARGVRGF